MKSNFIDISGRKFGLLTAVYVVGNKNGQTIWFCKCDCGNESKQSSANLRKNLVKSCGCGRVRHNGKNTRMYRIWEQMKQRCTNPKNSQFYNYGARGIGFCEQWLDFSNFQTDLLDLYTDHAAVHGEKDTTLERINNSKGYSPENCRWATKKEQRRNCRQSKYYSYKGQVITAGEISDLYGIKYETIESRMRLGWSIEKIIETPVNTKFRRNKTSA